jgi:hypothetical protein
MLGVKGVSFLHHGRVFIAEPRDPLLGLEAGWSYALTHVHVTFPKPIPIAFLAMPMR